MTRKDYEIVASIIARQGDEGCKAHPVRISTLRDTASAFALAFAADNPRFDSVKFLIACDLPQ